MVLVCYKPDYRIKAGGPGKFESCQPGCYLFLCEPARQRKMELEKVFVWQKIAVLFQGNRRIACRNENCFCLQAGGLDRLEPGDSRREPASLLYECMRTTSGLALAVNECFFESFPARLYQGRDACGVMISGLYSAMLSTCCLDFSNLLATVNSCQQEPP